MMKNQQNLIASLMAWIKRIEISACIILWGSLLIVWAIFTPLISAKPDCLPHLKYDSSEILKQETDGSKQAVTNISMFEFSKLRTMSITLDLTYEVNVACV